jgi:hypothetical protein
MIEVRRLAGLAGLLVALSGLAACTHVQAAQPGPSPLDVPAPPPRVVVPPSAELLDPPEPPAAPPVTAAAPAHPPTTPATRQPDKPATATTTTAPPPSDVVTPPPPLETTANTKPLEAETSALITSATKDLDRVDFVSLSTDAKAQYTRARSFVKQAEAALREKNVTYAKSMAEKAVALASQLPKTRIGSESESKEQGRRREGRK